MTYGDELSHHVVLRKVGQLSACSPEPALERIAASDHGFLGRCADGEGFDGHGFCLSDTVYTLDRLRLDVRLPHRLAEYDA